MNKAPEISVVTACYNHGRFIGEMLESVLSQTFDDYEVIIVNDGSTDDTARILNSISHEKVRIIHTENNGPAAARNTAIMNAKAKIIMNLDADDMAGPSLLEKAFKILCDDENTGIVYCDAELIGAGNGRIETGEYSREAMLIQNRIISLAFFRKEDWEKAGGYSDELLYGMEDWDLWLGIIGLGREVRKIKDASFYYRTYKNPAESRSGKRKSDRLKADISNCIIFNRHKKLYSDYPLIFKRFSRFEKKVKIKLFLNHLIFKNLFKTKYTDNYAVRK